MCQNLSVADNQWVLNRRRLFWKYCNCFHNSDNCWQFDIIISIQHWPFRLNFELVKRIGPNWTTLVWGGRLKICKFVVEVYFFLLSLRSTIIPQPHCHFCYFWVTVRCSHHPTPLHSNQSGATLHSMFLYLLALSFFFLRWIHLLWIIRPVFLITPKGILSNYQKPEILHSHLIVRWMIVCFLLCSGAFFFGFLMRVSLNRLNVCPC